MPSTYPTPAATATATATATAPQPGARTSGRCAEPNASLPAAETVLARHQGRLAIALQRMQRGTSAATATREAAIAARQQPMASAAAAEGVLLRMAAQEPARLFSTTGDDAMGAVLQGYTQVEKDLFSLLNLS
eukprot:5898000-Pleurochrysis_carterae.AAC.1